jgi:tetratricopeptide (TPR) repeat protein
VFQSLANIGRLHHAQRQFAVAEQELRAALAMGTKLFGAQHPQVATAMHNLAAMLDDAGSEEAGKLYEEALAVRRKILSANHLHLSYSLLGRGRWLAKKGRRGEAGPLLQEALLIRKKALPAGHPGISEVERVIAAKRD